MTGESWSEVVTRPIIFGWQDYGSFVSILFSTVYFISFILLNTFILFNVFVAVLLDKVVSSEHDMEAEEASVKAPDQSSRASHEHSNVSATVSADVTADATADAVVAPASVQGTNVSSNKDEVVSALLQQLASMEARRAKDHLALVERLDSMQGEILKLKEQSMRAPAASAAASPPPGPLQQFCSGLLHRGGATPPNESRLTA